VHELFDIAHAKDMKMIKFENTDKLVKLKNMIIINIEKETSLNS